MCLPVGRLRHCLDVLVDAVVGARNWRFSEPPIKLGLVELTRATGFTGYVAG